MEGILIKDEDIVSTSREILEKFIRELHRLTTYVKKLDPDGSHIRTLIVKFFLLYMPQVIQGGFLYASVPPLYGIEEKPATKNKPAQMKYFTEMIDYVKYIQNLFIKSNDLRDEKGKQIPKLEITNSLCRNMDYM